MLGINPAHKLTIIPGAAVVLMLVGGIREVHASVRVQPRAVGLPMSVPQNSTSEVTQAYCGTMEHRVLGIVAQAVGYHEVEVTLQLCKRAVSVGFQLGAHGGEVHGLGYELQIVWYLQGVDVFKAAERWRSSSRALSGTMT